MCKAKKPPKPKKPDKPEYLRNPYLDAAYGQSGTVNQLRTGRSQLRIDLDSGAAARAPVVPVAPSTPSPLRPPNPNSLIGRDSAGRTRRGLRPYRTQIQ